MITARDLCELSKKKERQLTSLSALKRDIEVNVLDASEYGRYYVRVSVERYSAQTIEKTVNWLDQLGYIVYVDSQKLFIRWG